QVGDEHHRARGRVDGLRRNRELGMARDHQVQLLLAAGAAAAHLVMALDDLVAGLRGRVGVDPEGAHAEPAPDRPVLHTGGPDPLQVVETGDAEGVAHAPGVSPAAPIQAMVAPGGYSTPGVPTTSS